MPALRLPEPYGYDFGDSVRITAKDADFSATGLIEVLTQYSCYPPAIPRAVACLTHSGRYDCTLQPNWFRNQRQNLTCALAELGLALEVTHEFVRPHQQQTHPT